MIKDSKGNIYESDPINGTPLLPGFYFHGAGGRDFFNHTMSTIYIGKMITQPIKPDPSPGNIIGNLETGDTYRILDSQPYGPNELLCMASYTKKLDMGYLMAISWSSLYKTEFLTGKEWQWLAMSESDLPADWLKQWEKEVQEYFKGKNKNASTEQDSTTVSEGGADRKPCSYNHDWKLYTGLNEVYEYCTICDTKREPLPKHKPNEDYYG